MIIHGCDLSSEMQHFAGLVESPSGGANGDGSGDDSLHSIINRAFHSRCCLLPYAICFHEGSFEALKTDLRPERPNLKWLHSDQELQVDGICHTRMLGMIIY